MGKPGWSIQAWLLSKKLRCAPTLTSWLSTKSGLMIKVFWEMRSGVCINLIHPLKSFGCRGWRQGGVHVYMSQQFDDLESLACLKFISKEFSQTMANVLPSRALSLHVFCVSKQCCLHSCFHTYRDVNAFGFESRFIPGHCNQVWLDEFFWGVPSLESLCVSESSSCQPYLPWNYLKPYSTMWLVNSTKANFKVL